ncbi:MAG: TonB-dependent receptor [Chitinophagaceae bacterium]|nr:TonB-dependent receptor [Chitinophagaceae bacterium]
MKTSILFLALIFFSEINYAQTIISGKITDKRNQPVGSASVRVKESGKGVRADSTGNYSLTLAERGSKTLIVSSVGFESKQVSVQLTDSSIRLDITLSPHARQLKDVVVVSAGTFEASDKAKGASLTPMDAMTVAGNGGDIAMSLRSLPGSQQVGEREGLFVRGGTGSETKQFVDGTLLKNPNYPSVPGIVQPARLNPFLFKGVLFNTGGYSALYGQALSGALILESVDLPDESAASLHIFPTSVGAGFQKLTRDKKSSYGASAQYGNQAFYNSIVGQRPDFYRSPLYISGDANFRIKSGKTGMLKFYTNYGYNHTGMRNPDIDSSGLLSLFDTKGSNVYANLSYKQLLGNEWKIDAGLAYNYQGQDITNRIQDRNHNDVFIPAVPFNTKNNTNNIRANFAQARVVFTKNLNRRQAFRIGAEHFFTRDEYIRNDTVSALDDQLTAAFAETDLYITQNVAAKIGVRSEYSSLLDQFSVAPRLGFAYRLKDGGQVNAAYGIFFQQPTSEYLLRGDGLSGMRATHYILNYQKKAHNRLIRIEAYYKKYRGLITTAPKVSNDGNGYAKGIELFFRDKKTFKDFDYWISYTYLDTKRRFNNYPYRLQPDFATPHTASLAVKRYFADLNFNVNLSYSIATGRPYYNIQNDESGVPYVFDNGKTNMYNQVNLSFAYLFSMFKKWKHPAFSGIGWGINNVFGSKSIFGYDYSYNGLFKTPITLPATRSYYLGIFMSFGIDRRDDFINENL